MERILRRPLASGGRARGRARALVESIGQIDLALACARLSRGWRGAPVEIGAAVVLRGARHPLLDPATAVPIDFELGELRAVVISGPNTGGKTVALKTLGLAAVLHQCGLRPPADRLVLPVFDAVLADIGDEQSIAMSLSTFSGHVRNLVEILGPEHRPLACPPRRGRGGHRSGRGRRARSGARRPARLAGAPDGGHEPLHGAEGVGERDRGRRERRDGLRLGHRRAALPHCARTPRHLPRPSDRRAARALGRARGDGPRPDSARTSAGRRAARRGRGCGEPGGGRASERRGGAPRGGSVPSACGRARGGARGGTRARARIGAGRARARGGAGGARAGRDPCRARRAPRGDPRRPRPGARAKAGEHAEGGREGARARPPSRCGVGTCRPRGPCAQGAGRAAPVTAPLAPGDPVVAPTLGVRGTIDEIVRDEAVVIGRGGLRVRVPLARLRPDRDAAADAPPEPAVTIHAPTPTDAPASSTSAVARARRRAKRSAPSSTRLRSPAATRRG